MSDYNKKLLDPRWQRKKSEIQIKYDFTCIQCNSKHNTLHVHHNYYLPLREPWDYPDSCFYLLCEVCHSHEHNIEQSTKEALYVSFKRSGFTNVSLWKIIDGLNFLKDLNGLHPDLVADCIGSMFYGRSIPLNFLEDYEKMDIDAVHVKAFMSFSDEDRQLLLKITDWDGIEDARSWFKKESEKFNEGLDF